MNRLFGYKRIAGDRSDYLSRLRPDFTPALERTGPDTALFLSGSPGNAERDSLFENSELLILLEGNVYFKGDFGTRYPESGRLRGDGVPSRLAALYARHGPTVFSDLTGDFVLIIQHKSDGKLLIVRDRMGGRKLYHTVVDGYLIFSTKLKSLLGVPTVSRDLDYFALESFIKFGCVVAPDTIFKSIRELEPGHLLEAVTNRFVTRPYWTLHAGREIDDSEGAIEEALYEKIEENISGRMKPEERIGLYLSGGIDSNTMLAMLSERCDPSEVVTMSIGYGEQYENYDELDQARFAASHFGSDHHELINGPEHLDEYLCETVWNFEQPFGNPALLSWTALAKLARELVDVVFVGAGADEVLGGYRRYNALNLIRLYNKIPSHEWTSRTLARLLGSLALGANHYGLAYRLHKLFDGIQPDVLSTNEMFLFGDYDHLRASVLSERVLSSQCEHVPALDRYYEMAESTDCLKQVFVADCYTDLVSEQLTRALIPLEQNAVDYRAPFSDPDLMSMCLNIPDRYKANIFRTKIIYKHAVDGILPRQIIKQKKRGMSHPVNLWLQGPLLGALNAVLSPENRALQAYFHVDHLRSLAEEHASRKRDWGNLLWKMIVFSMWHELFIENEGSDMPDLRLKDLCRTPGASPTFSA